MRMSRPEPEVIMNGHTAAMDEFAQARQTVEAIETELIKSVDMAKEERLAMLAGLAVGGHVLMDAVYGTGKTTAAKALSRTISGTFARIQGTPDVLPSDITGSRIFNQKTQEFDFMPGPIFSNVLLADELQRMPEKSQSGLIEAMEEGQVTPAGSRESLELPNPQLVIATRNPDGLPIGGGIIDRFMIGIQPGSQDAAARSRIFELKQRGYQPKPIRTADQILEVQDVVKEIVIAPEVKEKANELHDRVYSDSRLNHDETIEGGFRPFYNLLQTAQFSALYSNRRIVDVHDLAFAAPATLSHRLALHYEAEDKGFVARDIVADAIKEMGLISPYAKATA